MPTDEQFAELEGRITELENRLGARREQVSVTRKEYEAYLKVSNLVSDQLSMVNNSVIDQSPPDSTVIPTGSPIKVHLCHRPCGLPPVVILPLPLDVASAEEGGGDRFDDLGG